MCGINGIFSKNSHIDLKKYYDAHILLKHRGPDDEGFVAGTRYSEDIYFLSGEGTSGASKRFQNILSMTEQCSWIIGHNRLSIIDLSDHGHQPMLDVLHNYTLSYNGEIYNYIEIRQELKSLGYTFFSDSDTEVVLNALIEWGVEAFSRFNGMWALAFYNIREKELILSRDRFGVKPLYILKDSVNFYFASEAKFFRPFKKLSINENIVLEYLQSSKADFSRETFYDEICSLDPGTYMVINEQMEEKHSRYWSVSTIKNENYSDETIVDRFQYLFNSSIDLRMRSDVPVGSLLSGGLDSSAIVCNLFDRKKYSASGFHAFSAVFENEKFSEKKYIEETSQKCSGLVTHYIYPSVSEYIQEFQKMAYIQDFPFRSLAVYSQNVLYKKVKSNSSVVVLLNGQGADELFGGYSAHYASLVSSYIFKFQWINALKEAKFLFKIRDVEKLSFIKSVLFQLLLAYKRLSGIQNSRTIHSSVFNRDFKRHYPAGGIDPLDNALVNNLTYSALPEYLRYDDRNSMAHSLEARLPFLDYRLVEFAFSIANRYKIQKGVNKKIVRDSVRKYVPQNIVDRGDKMGFVSPQEIWQRNEMKPMIDNAVNNIDLDILNRKELLKKYELYTKEKSNDWPFWWRITSLFHWMDIK